MMTNFPKFGGSLTTLDPPVKALFSCFLITIGLGYLSAVYFLFTADVDPHRKMGMTVVAGIEAKYRGNRGGTLLESALRGEMSSRINSEDRAQIIGWLRKGATQEGFAGVKPILEKNCTTCHNAKSGLPILPLTNFEEVKKVAEVDTGLSLAQLARESHIHLFGISLIFLLTGAIFALTGISSKWKIFIIVLPFASIWLDIGSWWITKYAPMFAYLVLSGGALMGTALALQLLIPLWEMWFVPRTVGKAIDRERET